jgi:hypothetical protein
MSKIDPTDKAGECERALELTLDADRRAILTWLRALWIEVENARHFFSSEADFAEQLEKVGRLHAALLGPVPNVH